MRRAVCSMVIAAGFFGCSGAAPERQAGARPAERQPPSAQRVVDELASRLGVTPSELRVTAWEEVVWSSAALGCPEPGKMYAQATTPGWRLTVVGPGETSRQVHTDADGSAWVVCERGHRVLPEPA